MEDMLNPQSNLLPEKKVGRLLEWVVNSDPQIKTSRASGAHFRIIYYYQNKTFSSPLEVVEGAPVLWVIVRRK